MKMKFKRVVLLAVSVLVLAVTGCEKEEESAKYLSGAVNLTIPEYVLPGSSIGIKVDDVSSLHREDGRKLGYYFSNPTTEKKDTVIFLDGVPNPSYPEGKYTFVAPSKVGQYSLVLTGFTDAEYYNSSSTAKFTVVQPETALTGYLYTGSCGKFTDPRDGKTYDTARIGNVEWFRQNLRWEEAGYPYKGCVAMKDVFGMYYSWLEAQSACPPGWRLPKDSEIGDLASSYSVGDLMADIYFLDNRMWEYWPDVEVTDNVRLSLLPLGYATMPDGSYNFSGLYGYSTLWTSDSEEGEGVCRYIYSGETEFFRAVMPASDVAMSVRCVRDL